MNNFGFTSLDVHMVLEAINRCPHLIRIDAAQKHRWISISGPESHASHKWKSSRSSSAKHPRL